MNTVERIKDICKDNNISISKLERECGFSNGYINSLKKGTLPNDRLQTVADYLKVSPNFLSTGITDEYYVNDEVKQIAQKIFESKELRLLFDAAEGANPEDLLTVHAMLKALKSKEGGNIE